MTWEPGKGDIGRFESESSGHPRFVVIRVKVPIVWVWYSGAAMNQRIHLETFRRDCVESWNIDIVDPPEWLKEEVLFRLNDWVTLARITDDPYRSRTPTRIERLDLNGLDLKVFSSRLDHVACLVPALRTMVLVPIKAVIEQGYRLRTKWERLLADDELDDYEDYL